MLKKGSKLNSILTGSCPKCQNESMYVDKNPLHLGKVLKMNENCSHCGLKYQIEPSFFYGAMYVSYGFIVLLVITSLVILHIYFNQPIEVVMGVNLGIVILGYPLLLRYSRVLYLYLFVRYKKSDER